MKSQVVVAPENLNLNGFLNFSFDTSLKKLNPPLGISAAPGVITVQPFEEDMTEYDKLDDDCFAQRQAQSSQSFGGASWDVSFANSTRVSWNFAGMSSSKLGDDPMINELIFDATNSDRTVPNVTFQIRSIVGVCRIKNSADFVAGFFACDKLIIESRTKPLRIIASIIAGKLEIDPTAYISGITWSSIYYPQATSELRSVGILSAPSGATCQGIVSIPIWHPKPSIQTQNDRYFCNAVSLRDKADPFRWTSVDPDCGVIPNTAGTTCKQRVIRFFVIEHSREELF